MKYRVAAVQFMLHTVDSVEQFAAQCEHYIHIAAEFDTDMVLFPEFVTTPLLTVGRGALPARPIEALPDFTEVYEETFRAMAQKHRMYVFGGTHVVRQADKLYNMAYLFYPDGRIGRQPKLHITPTEVKEWGIHPGDGLQLFDTEFGKLALLTCYDIEFPEIVRMARARGADVVFCPSCTDDRHGFYRVRYCCHARAVENQVYIVTTGTVGSLPTVDFMRSNFGQAAVISPNDVPFPPRGIVAEGELNHDMVVVADLDLTLLHQVREKGSVTTWRDRRTDLYTDWT